MFRRENIGVHIIRPIKLCVDFNFPFYFCLTERVEKQSNIKYSRQTSTNRRHKYGRGRRTILHRMGGTGSR